MSFSCVGLHDRGVLRDVFIMSKPKEKKPSAPVGLAALPTFLNAKKTAEAVLAQLHESGAITKDQIDKNLPSITLIVQKLNDQQETFWKSVYASVNARASHSERQAESVKHSTTLFVWLDKHMPKHRGNLDHVAERAVSERVVPRSVPWVRKQITEWKKLHRNIVR